MVWSVYANILFVFLCIVVIMAQKSYSVFKCNIANLSHAVMLFFLKKSCIVMNINS